MEIKQAVSILENHNEWRRNDEIPNAVPMVEPKELGIAIDVITNFFKDKEKTVTYTVSAHRERYELNDSDFLNRLKLSLFKKIIRDFPKSIKIKGLEKDYKFGDKPKVSVSFSFLQKSFDFKIFYVKKVKDFESDWYWIPEEKIELFNELNEELSGMEYLDNPDLFEKFNDEFDGFSTGGSPDLVPHNFENKNVEFL